MLACRKLEVVKCRQKQENLRRICEAGQGFSWLEVGMGIEQGFVEG